MKTASKVIDKRPALDWLKWSLAMLLVVLAIGGNVYYGSQPLLWRVMGVLGAGVVALFLIATTMTGQAAWQFFQSSRAELRKVVWPTRQETIQVTLLVGVLVLITAVILWGIDSVLLKLMALLTGTRGA